MDPLLDCHSSTWTLAIPANPRVGKSGSSKSTWVRGNMSRKANEWNEWNSWSYEKNRRFWEKGEIGWVKKKGGHRQFIRDNAKSTPRGAKRLFCTNCCSIRCSLDRFLSQIRPWNWSGNLGNIFSTVGSLGVSGDALTQGKLSRESPMNRIQLNPPRLQEERAEFILFGQLFPFYFFSPFPLRLLLLEKRYFST